MENFKEVWRPVVGYEGLYEVSNTGKVDALNYHHEKRRDRMKTRIDKQGYVVVRLYKNGKVRNYFVHRLVAIAFIQNNKNLPQVNHKDENKQNNCIENLEWCDCKYNVNYGTAKNRMAKKNGIPVIQLTLKGEIIAKYESISEAARALGIPDSSIWNVCHGGQKTTAHFKWRFEDDEKYIKSQLRREKIEKSNLEQRNILYTKRARPVVQFSIDGKVIDEYRSYGVASKKTGITKNSIWYACQAGGKKTHGYIFKYKEDVK